MTQFRSIFFSIGLIFAIFSGASAHAEVIVVEHELPPPQLLNAGQLDPIASRSFQYRAQDPAAVLNATVAKLKSVFQRYRPVVDSGTTITKPLVVSGSESNPRLQMSAKKCVLFICETVDLDASVTIREVNGNCTRNFILTADLGRSTQKLVDNFRALKVNICAQIADASADLRIDAFAERGARYESGTITNEIFKILSAQIPAMTTALTESLKANGAR
ncbi:MAG: hypothetical protein KF767_11265 [Bdellovibrionaceae bacterium]|nr:hypothetical protein [Pseudobdellovibrionaceae bacterium]